MCFDFYELLFRIYWIDIIDHVWDILGVIVTIGCYFFFLFFFVFVFYFLFWFDILAWIRITYGNISNLCLIGKIFELIQIDYLFVWQQFFFSSSFAHFFFGTLVNVIKHFVLLLFVTFVFWLSDDNLNVWLYIVFFYFRSFSCVRLKNFSIICRVCDKIVCIFFMVWQ